MSDLSDPNDNASRTEEAWNEAATKNPILTHKHQRGEVICRKCDFPNDRYVDGYATCTDCAEPHPEEELKDRIRGYK